MGKQWSHVEALGGKWYLYWILLCHTEHHPEGTLNCEPNKSRIYILYALSNLEVFARHISLFQVGMKDLKDKMPKILSVI